MLWGEKNKNKKSTWQSQHQYKFAQVTTISLGMIPKLCLMSALMQKLFYVRITVQQQEAWIHPSMRAAQLHGRGHADVDDAASRTTRSISTWHIVFFKRTHFPKWNRSQQSCQDILDNWVDISCCPGFCTDTWSITCKLSSRLSVLERR